MIKLVLQYICVVFGDLVVIRLLGSSSECTFLTNLSRQLHQVLVQLQSGEKEQDFSLAPIQVSISVQLWRLPGCHEFLAALGKC